MFVVTELFLFVVFLIVAIYPCDCCIMCYFYSLHTACSEAQYRSCVSSYSTSFLSVLSEAHRWSKNMNM